MCGYMVLSTYLLRLLPVRVRLPGPVRRGPALHPGDVPLRLPHRGRRPRGRVGRLRGDTRRRDSLHRRIRRVTAQRRSHSRK